MISARLLLTNLDLLLRFRRRQQLEADVHCQGY
jgi:hypothetical protein